MDNQNKILALLKNSYNFGEALTLKPIKSGLINSTYRLMTPQQNFIVQEVSPIFKHPHYIDQNINALSKFLFKKKIDFKYPTLSINKKGKTITFSDKKYFRVFEEIENSMSYAICKSAEMGFEAGTLLGKVYRALKNFKTDSLKPSIPNFHNLIIIEKKFVKSYKNASKELLLKARKAIELLDNYAWVTKYYQELIQNKIIKMRPTHHDTKISNFLFDTNKQAVAIIDFDTFFSGYFLSDLGDMYRTYLPEYDENKKLNNFKIEINQDIYNSINQGFVSQTKLVFTKTEHKQFPFSGYFMIYMQALRFLADYFNGNVYYPINYPSHNLVRAQNQIALLCAFDNMAKFKN